MMVAGIYADKAVKVGFDNISLDKTETDIIAQMTLVKKLLAGENESFGYHGSWLAITQQIRTKWCKQGRKSRPSSSWPRCHGQWLASGYDSYGRCR